MFFNKGSKHRSKKADDPKSKVGELLEDDYFSTDKGLSKIEISGLGEGFTGSISSSGKAIAAPESVEAASILSSAKFVREPQQNDSDPFFVLGSNKKARPTNQTPPAEVKRPVSFDYGIDSPAAEEPRSPTHSSAQPTAPVHKAMDVNSADAVFSSDFDPFKLAMSEELANKPSSRSKAEERPRVSERLSEITEEDVRRARQLADEQLKRQKKKEEFERKKAEYFASIRKNEPISAQPTTPSYPQKTEEPAAPTYSYKAEEPVAPTNTYKAEEPAAPTNTYKAEEPLAPAYNVEPPREELPKVVHIEFGGNDAPETEKALKPEYGDKQPTHSNSYGYPPYSAPITAPAEEKAAPSFGSSYRRAAEFARATLDSTPTEPVTPSYSYKAEEPVAPTYSYKAEEPTAPTYSYKAEEPAAPTYSYKAEEPAAPTYSYKAEEPIAPTYSYKAEEPVTPTAPTFKDFPAVNPDPEDESGLVFEIDESIPREAPKRQPETLQTERTLFGLGDDDDEEDEDGIEFIQYEDEDGAEEEESDAEEDENETDEDWANEEIPPERQNPDVINMRSSFSVLDEDDAPTLEAEPEVEEFDGDEPDGEEPESKDEEIGYTDDEDEDEDDVPFDMPEVRTPPKPPKKEDKPVQKKKIDYSGYTPPPLELLGLDEKADDSETYAEIQENIKTIIETLASFHVTASIKAVEKGPRITRYEVVPAKGVKVNQITNLFDDIKLYLAAEGIRMEAPIPGKSAIGFEIPNKQSVNVRLRELLECDEFINAKSNTYVCIGKDVAGYPVFGDIGKFPHALIAGATGMGKSVAINAIMISMLYKARPDQVKFIMIDPKKVEFKMYSGIPHLLIPVITEAKQAAGALMWAVEEMERRYELIEKLNIRNIDAYNERQTQDPSIGEYMPKIIVVIDELNDLMMQVRDPVEDLIMRIAQKARAAGIHLIIGTQRPDVKVVTGTIKANINTRISCKVTSVVDSRTILEMSGAEKLLNRGDMLFKPADKTSPVRVQGAFVSDSEVEDIMNFLKNQTPDGQYDDEIFAEINKAAQKCGNKKGSSQNLEDDSGDDSNACGYYSDQQFLDAVELAIRLRKVATSLLQRKMSIGYSKAAKFIDCMEEIGVVGPSNGSKPREVLIDLDEWYEKLSRVGND